MNQFLFRYSGYYRRQCGEGLSPLDDSSCLDVLEKFSNAQNPGQSNRTTLPLHADIHTLYGLAYACPHFERKGDCPLKVIEKLPFKQKVLWVNGLSKEEKETILKHHEACSLKR